MISPGDDMSHMGEENMENECGSPIDKSGDNAVEKEVDEEVSVCTEGGTSSQATEAQVPRMDTKVSVANEAVSIL